MLGRRAMGERVRAAALRDRREVRRDGPPVLVDPLRLEGRPLGADGPRCCAGRGRSPAWLGCGPAAEDAAAAVAGIAVEGVEAGVSGWAGGRPARLRRATRCRLRGYLVAVLILVWPGRRPASGSP